MSPFLTLSEPCHACGTARNTTSNALGLTTDPVAQRAKVPETLNQDEAVITVAPKINRDIRCFPDQTVEAHTHTQTGAVLDFNAVMGRVLYRVWDHDRQVDMARRSRTVGNVLSK
jgi:hypothetical protein